MSNHQNKNLTNIYNCKIIKFYFSINFLLNKLKSRNEKVVIFSTPDTFVLLDTTTLIYCF